MSRCAFMPNCEHVGVERAQHGAAMQEGHVVMLFTSVERQPEVQHKLWHCGHGHVDVGMVDTKL